jgi:tetratricopeptide (TPR) repeat protein
MNRPQVACLVAGGLGVGVALGVAVTAKALHVGHFDIGQQETPRSTRPSPELGEPLVRAKDAIANAPHADVATPPHRAERERVMRPRSVFIDELERARSAGLVDDAQLAAAYVEALLSRKMPAEAFEFLRRHEVDEVRLLARVAESAARLELTELAAEVYATALRLQPEGVIARKLGNLDPARLVTELDLLVTHTGRALRGDLAEARGWALTRLGRVAEARAIALDLLVRRPDDSQALQLLAQVDPAEAEARLRGLAETDARNPTWVTRLAYLLEDRGAGAEAEGLLLGYMSDRADEAQVSYALHALMNTVPDAAYRWMADTAAIDGRAYDAGEWEYVADCLADRGRVDLAVDAWSRALSEETEIPDESVRDGLREHAPGRLLAILEGRVSSGAPVEFHGALADEYWAAGRREDARAMWERAHELDPAASWWTRRLEQLAAGADPMED